MEKVLDGASLGVLQGRGCYTPKWEYWCLIKWCLEVISLMAFSFIFTQLLICGDTRVISRLNVGCNGPANQVECCRLNFKLAGKILNLLWAVVAQEYSSCSTHFLLCDGCCFWNNNKYISVFLMIMSLGTSFWKITKIPMQKKIST